MKNRFCAALACLLLLAGSFCVRASAEEAEARDISGTELLAGIEGFPSSSALFDGAVLSGRATEGNAQLTLEYAEGIGSLYFLFDIPYGEYTITDNGSGNVYTAGRNGFLHEFVDLTAAFGQAPTSVTVNFANGSVKLYELYVYTPGRVPDSVQKWEAPVNSRTDLVLFSTHGDDEQLFFAGVLPYYAGQMGYQVQVVYMTDHREGEPHRIHEMLNGLWSVGVTSYPVAADFPDFRRDSLSETYDGFAYRGYTREELLGYVVENLRRFKPLVAVGHDINGEYGHGMHMAYADLLMEAVQIASDPEKYPGSAKAYGVWDTPKTYLHLYKENKVVMDWDQPLDSFGGMTAFEVTQKLGFPCHESQFQDFAWYHSYEKRAKDVQLYSPCEFGLYRSTVGADVQKNDFFENLTVYAEQMRLLEDRLRKAEEQAAAEQAKQHDRVFAELALVRERAQQQLEDDASRREWLADGVPAVSEQLHLASEAVQRRLITIAVAAAVCVAALVTVSFWLWPRIKPKQGRYAR